MTRSRHVILAALFLVGSVLGRPSAGDELQDILQEPAAAVPARQPVVLSTNRLALKVGAAFRIEVKAGGPVVWASSNPGFATVAPDGLVAGVHEGTLTITATPAGGGTPAECLVEVETGPAAPPVAPVGPRTITAIRIVNEIDGMAVGEELGIVAVCLPYRVFEDNVYTLETSDPGVVQVDSANVATAVGEGTVTLTARSTNGCTDRISFGVRAAAPTGEPAASETYEVEPDRFGIVTGEVDEAQSVRNTAGINQTLLFARRHGYRTVVFPRGLYVLDPLASISMRSDLTVDLNGSTWQIRPNGYASYALIRFRELNRPNVCDGLDAAARESKQPALSAGPVDTYDIPAGTTSLWSRAVPVAPFPPKDAPDQVVRALERGESVVVSCPIGLLQLAAEPDPLALTPEGPPSLRVQARLNYCQGAAVVATQDLGNVWIRDAKAGRWNDYVKEPRLRAQEDYDAVRLELVFSLENCRAEAFVDRPSICGRVSSVLENCCLRNGTILGEREFKERFYPGWHSDGKTEGAVAISFEEGPNNGIDSLTVRKGIGFNIGSRLGQGSSGAVGVGPVSLLARNLELGDYDGQGRKVEAAHLQRTKELINLGPIGETFELGLPLGYMGYNILRVRLYDILFYDADKALIERRNGRMTYRKYTKPEAARYAHVVLHWDVPITKGHPDFSDAIAFFTEYHPPLANYIRNCVIEDNYSTGMAACGGINWRIEGNIFRRNGGRMPGCDIDWEDGWEYSQDDIVRNNSFESPVGLIVCSGLNRVFRGNAVTGKTIVYGRSQYMRYVDNTFGGGASAAKVAFGTQTETYICGNTFLGGPVSLSREHGAKAAYAGLWLNNVFRDAAVGPACARNDIVADNQLVRTELVP